MVPLATALCCGLHRCDISFSVKPWLCSVSHILGIKHINPVSEVPAVEIKVCECTVSVRCVDVGEVGAR